MAQERQRVRIEKKQYFDRNIWDMSIDITYFVLDILQVVISRSAYYISFERMCLTVYGPINSYHSFRWNNLILFLYNVDTLNICMKEFSSEIIIFDKT